MKLQKELKKNLSKYGTIVKKRKMKLQELVNKLSNILASGASEADVKIDDKHIETVTLVEIDGVQTLAITGVE